MTLAIQGNYEKDRIFAYDEVGCLTDLFEGKFLSKNVQKDEVISKTSFRGLFDVFADSVLSIQDLKSWQILSGTTLSGANVLSLNISAFKKEEIVVISPITPFTEREISQIMKYYFGGLNFDERTTNRWAGRGRFIMQYLVQNLFQKAISQKSILCQEIFDSQEPIWYNSAIATMETYIQSYLEIEMKTGKYLHEKKVKEILELIYHDCVMGRKGKKYMLGYEEATNLVQQGIMFLPSTFREKDFEVQMFQEVISFDALGQYFQMKREDEGNILEDTILKLCFTELKQETEGSGYVWEDYFCRFVMLNLQPKIGSRSSLSESTLMTKFIQMDQSLKFYTLEAQYIIDQETIDLEGFLLSNDTTKVYFPDQMAGPDTCIPLARLTLRECRVLEPSMSKTAYSSLPKVRFLVVQDKYLTTVILCVKYNMQKILVICRNVILARNRKRNRTNASSLNPFCAPKRGRISLIGVLVSFVLLEVFQRTWIGTLSR
jgi:hypothetical protein